MNGQIGHDEAMAIGKLILVAYPASMIFLIVFRMLAGWIRGNS